MRFFLLYQTCQKKSWHATKKSSWNLLISFCLLSMLKIYECKGCFWMELIWVHSLEWYLHCRMPKFGRIQPHWFCLLLIYTGIWWSMTPDMKNFISRAIASDQAWSMGKLPEKYFYKHLVIFLKTIFHVLFSCYCISLLIKSLASLLMARMNWGSILDFGFCCLILKWRGSLFVQLYWLILKIIIFENAFLLFDDFRSIPGRKDILDVCGQMEADIYQSLIYQIQFRILHPSFSGLTSIQWNPHSSQW